MCGGRGMQKTLANTEREKYKSHSNSMHAFNDAHASYTYLPCCHFHSSLFVKPDLKTKSLIFLYKRIANKCSNHAALYTCFIEQFDFVMNCLSYVIAFSAVWMGAHCSIFVYLVPLTDFDV